eukprot:1262967-Prymnesium_polylepis.2
MEHAASIIDGGWTRVPSPLNPCKMVLEGGAMQRTGTLHEAQRRRVLALAEVKVAHIREDHREEARL